MLEYSYNSVGRKSLNTRITIELSNCGVNDSKYRPNSETKHVHLHAFKPELRSLRARNTNVFLPSFEIPRRTPECIMFQNKNERTSERK